MQILRLRKNAMDNTDIEDLLSSLNFVSDTSFTAPEVPEVRVDVEANIPAETEHTILPQSESIPSITRRVVNATPENLEAVHTHIVDDINSATQPEDISTTLAEYGFYGEGEENEDNDLEEEIVQEETIPDLQESQEPESSEESTNEVSQVDDAVLSTNSPTLLMDETTTRFSGAEWFGEIQKKQILVAGVGGIGSNLVFQLARMCPNKIVMYDNDVVELVNMAGQLYSHNDVGRSKVDALRRMIRDYTNTQNVYAVTNLYDTNDKSDIMMCGFDNMNARKSFFESWLAHVRDLNTDKSMCLYMDGRLSMDTLQIICIQGTDDYNIERYQKEFLFTDEEAEHTVCSMKQTTYLACMIGSLMVNLFTNWVANSLNPIIPYDLPFFTEYSAQNMIFRTQV